MRFPFSNCRKQLCFVTKQNEAIARAVSSQSDSSLQRRAQKREHKYRKKTSPTNEKERMITGMSHACDMDNSAPFLLKI